MKKYYKIFYTINPVVRVLFILSITHILLYKLLFLKYSEIFSGASAAGEIFYNIAMALVASTIFYFVVVHIKDYNDKKIVMKITNNKLNRILNVKNSILNELLKASKLSVDLEKLKLDDVENILKRIKPDGNSPLIVFSLSVHGNTWLEFLIHYSHQIENIINDIYKLMPFLDTELLDRLFEIESSKFISHLAPFDGYGHYTYPDLSPFAKAFFDFIHLVEGIKIYMNKMKKYYE